MSTPPTSTNSTTNTLTSNTWVATANDSLITQDVYAGVNGQSVITGIQSLFNALDLSIYDILRGGQYVAAAVPLLSSLIQSGEAVFNQAAVLARILAATPSVTNYMINSLSATAQATVTGEMSNDAQVVATVNGVAQQVTANSITDINALATLMNKLTGNTALFTVEDQDAQVGLIAGLVVECTSLGIPNSVSALIGQITDPSLQTQVIAKVLPSVVAAGDTASLTSIAGILGDQGTYAINPSVLSDFASSYVAPALSTTGPAAVNSQTAAGIAATYTTLLNTFSAVDSTWNVGTRAGPPDGSGNPTTISILNLVPLLTSSEDMQQAVVSGAQLANAIGANTTPPPPTDLNPLVSLFGIQDVDTCLQASFPYTVFQANVKNVGGFVDPQLLASNPSLAPTQDVAFS